MRDVFQRNAEWREAARRWGAPPVVEETHMAPAATVWEPRWIGYALKRLGRRGETGKIAVSDSTAASSDSCLQRRR